VFYQVKTGEFHYFPDFLPVCGSVAVDFAFLAHWLGVMGALHHLGQAVIHQLVTVFTKQYLLIPQALHHPRVLHNKNISILAVVFFAAEDRDEIPQDLDIPAFFVV
jgi:hypothetical protein